MTKSWAQGVLILVACHPEVPIDEPAPAREPALAGEPGPAPDPSVPGLVVRNPESVGIEIYAAHIVDRRGELGTRVLWPHAYDCPGVEPPPRLVAGGGGTRWLPPPVEAYVPGQCTPSPLPPGDYVLQLASGYGEELYAAAAITLPLIAPVELEILRHEHGPPCDAALARRAATLAFAAAEASGALPVGLREECDVSTARCGTLPLDEALPPPTCTVTLHERLLRVERAAATDTPRWLTAWADPEVVFVQQPDVPRTSASRVDIEGETIIVAGRTSHHIHEHGGDSAGVASATFDVHTPLERPLRLRVRGIEFLTDHSCGLPEAVRASPKLAGLSPEQLAPGASEVSVTFAPQAAYQAHCDRFATRVTFLIEGHPVVATVEHEVTREEPMREH
jgi:hypothetical protein